MKIQGPYTRWGLKNSEQAIIECSKLSELDKLKIYMLYYIDTYFLPGPTRSFENFKEVLLFDWFFIYYATPGQTDQKQS